MEKIYNKSSLIKHINESRENNDKKDIILSKKDIDKVILEIKFNGKVYSKSELLEMIKK